jgi:hypothetical protein
MESKIDYQRIAKEWGIRYHESGEPNDDVIEAMKEAVQQALTIILEDVAENAKAYMSQGSIETMFDDDPLVSKGSILGRADELKIKLGITT